MTATTAATKALCLVLCVSTTACASLGGGSSFAPLVDHRGRTPAAYASDLAQCQDYARQVASAETKAVVGAVVGALLGAALAAAAGGGYSRNSSARVGAVSGAVSGGAHGAESQENIIRRCLAGRGYAVLN